MDCQKLTAVSLFAGMQPEEIEAVLNCFGVQSAQYERGLWAQEETAARQKALDAGCREITLSDEELERFRTLVQPLYAQFCAAYLPLVEEIQQE